MASTHDLRTTVEKERFQNVGVLKMYKETIDFATDFTAGVVQSATVSLRTLPAGIVILGAFINVLTAQSDVTDVDLGYTTDGSTGAQLIDGISLASAVPVFTAGIATPLHVTADSIIVLTNKDAQTISTAKIEVAVIYAELVV